MILKKEVDRKDFYKVYYTTLNGILNLTNKQIEVLAEFSNIYDELSDAFTTDQKDDFTFSSSSRSIICENLGISIFNLNNIIKELRLKNFIITKKKGYKINPFLQIKRTNEIDVNFKFLLKD